MRTSKDTPAHAGVHKGRTRTRCLVVSHEKMNNRYLARDLEHQRDHRYGPSDLATGAEWSADTVDLWMLSEDGEITDILSQLLAQEGMGSIADAVTKSKAIDAEALSAIIWEMSEG